MSEQNNVEMESVYNSILIDGERLTLLHFFIEVLKEYQGENTPDIDELIACLDLLYTELLTSIQKERAHELSPEISDLRKELFQMVMSFKSSLKSFLTKKDEARVAIAKAGMEIFNKAFGDLNLNSSTDLSIGVNTLLSLINNPPTISLDEFTLDIDLQQIEQNSVKLQELVSLRAIDEETNDTLSLVHARDNVGHQFVLMKEQIRMKQKMGKIVYAEIAHKFNGRISEIMPVAKARHSHQENESKAQQEDLTSENDFGNTEEGNEENNE